MPVTPPLLIRLFEFSLKENSHNAKSLEEFVIGQVEKHDDVASVFEWKRNLVWIEDFGDQIVAVFGIVSRLEVEVRVTFSPKDILIEVFPSDEEYNSSVKFELVGNFFEKVRSTHDEWKAMSPCALCDKTGITSLNSAYPVTEAYGAMCCDKCAEEEVNEKL